VKNRLAGRPAHSMSFMPVAEQPLQPHSPRQGVLRTLVDEWDSMTTCERKRMLSAIFDSIAAGPLGVDGLEPCDDWRPLYRGRDTEGGATGASGAEEGTRRCSHPDTSCDMAALPRDGRDRDHTGVRLLESSPTVVRPTAWFATAARVDLAPAAISRGLDTARVPSVPIERQ